MMIVGISYKHIDVIGSVDIFRHVSHEEIWLKFRRQNMILIGYIVPIRIFAVTSFSSPMMMFSRSNVQ